MEATVEPPIAAVAATPAPPPAPQPAAAEPVDSGAPAPSGLLAKIQAKLDETHPLLAQSLSRTCGIDVAGEGLVFRFPPTAGLFADRFKDPEIKPALRAACEAALGRSVAPRVEIDPNAPPPPPRPKPPAEKPRMAPVTSEPPNLAPPPLDDDIPHPADTPTAHPAAGPPPATANPAPAAATPRPARTPASPELRRQVENEPAVQDLLTELKGSVLSVEEL